MSSQKTLAPIQLPNVSQVVYEVLRKQILSGQFSPGQQLNLNELEDQLQVSRTPLKLALERLQLDGLIDVHPRRGTFVTIFKGVDIRECFQVRIALEAEALRYAFKPTHADRLRDLIRQFEEMDRFFLDEATWLDELTDFMDRDRAAHITMIGFSENSRMREAYERANVQGYIAMMGTKFSFHDTRKTQAEHLEIYRALTDGNLTRLLDAARHHLEKAGERALNRLAGSEETVK